MKRAEAGVRYSAHCPGCRAHLVVGWVRVGDQLPPGSIAGEVVGDLARGPVACRCGKISLRLHPDAPRGVLEWNGPTQPALGVEAVQGSARQEVGP